MRKYEPPYIHKKFLFICYTNTERILKICKLNNSETYINAIGGKNFYDKKYFSDNKVSLYFIKSNLIQYKQFKNDFVDNLSVIDVMMFNSLFEIQKMLGDYELI